ncbi:helix-turn-helix transcriptional regulator, partial [Desulfosporosinus sp. BICA1-9]|uniref:helix-turn-helix domain-containing protein n=1 Tax=Desulfosporosinus sp. BICA1-9 TaxID=1531958 RepID=UPI0025C10E61
KGMELKDVEEFTKIRCKYLQALEEEDYCVLPGEVYTVGFLRSYARFLDIDSESLVNTFRMKINATKLETTFDYSKQERKPWLQDQYLVAKVLQFYRAFKFFKTNTMEESKR